MNSFYSHEQLGLLPLALEQVFKGHAVRTMPVTGYCAVERLR